MLGTTLNLPSQFLSTTGVGGGVIQGTLIAYVYMLMFRWIQHVICIYIYIYIQGSAGEAAIVVLLAARNKSLNAIKGISTAWKPLSLSHPLLIICHSPHLLRYHSPSCSLAFLALSSSLLFSFLLFSLLFLTSLIPFSCRPFPTSPPLKTHLREQQL